MQRFLSALGTEIELRGRSEWAEGVTIGSVFFGGGTPSLLSADELGEILNRLRKFFAVRPDAEVTVEANPESVDAAKMEGYRAAGVNRLSLGVQSLDDRALSVLGRLHSAREAREAFAAARRAGFDNINVDLIYGFPGLDTGLWERTVSAALSWEPEHLSTYALTLDDGSAWRSQGVSSMPSEEKVVEQYWALARLARQAGYEHYEISNYARPGFRSLHNQIYWRGEEYLAFGPGGSGFLGDIRYTNVKPVERYVRLLEAGESPIGQWERLTERQRLGERLILGLRLSDGIPLAWLSERFADEPGRLEALIETWAARDLLAIEDGRARLTEAGFLLSDSLFVELL
jgi:oxygen-independent coproporphyrinogen-3 oxidase